VKGKSVAAVALYIADAEAFFFPQARVLSKVVEDLGAGGITPAVRRTPVDKREEENTREKGVLRDKRRKKKKKKRRQKKKKKKISKKKKKNPQIREKNQEEKKKNQPNNTHKSRIRKT